ncbi:helix-turn-helix domain-containing protein [Paracoccaceae bacterium Fryx2]|nr:helix-turn-helix domain-containing protein [Paracoccaceae bacterium Fryx2]
MDATISALRSVIGAHNDAELAAKLEIDKSTISNWRSRGRVPQKFAKILDVAAHDVWPELHDRALAVALPRYGILRQPVVGSANLDAALAAFLDTKPFWFVVYRAAAELRLKMETLKIDLGSAAALILQEDLRDPSATALRVAAQLAEDEVENPNLSTAQPPHAPDNR